MSFFIDSSAWVEYIDGSEKGKKVQKILEDEEEVYSIPLIVSEVVSKAKRTGKDVDLCFNVIVSNSKIIEVNLELSKQAGILHAKIKKKKRDFGLVDAIIWICAERLNARLVTCDYHFKNFKKVVLL